jgi:hypothetical protein
MTARFEIRNVENVNRRSVAFWYSLNQMERIRTSVKYTALSIQELTGGHRLSPSLNKILLLPMDSTVVTVSSTVRFTRKNITELSTQSANSLPVLSDGECSRMIQ